MTPSTPSHFTAIRGDGTSEEYFGERADCGEYRSSLFADRGNYSAIHRVHVLESDDHFDRFTNTYLVHAGGRRSTPVKGSERDRLTDWL